MAIKINWNEANINKNRDQTITRDQGKNEEEERIGEKTEGVGKTKWGVVSLFIGVWEHTDVSDSNAGKYN